MTTDEATPTEVARPVARRRRPLWAILVGGAGEILITGGIVILLFVVYELWITGIFTHREQHKLEVAIHKEWTQPPKPNAPIAGVAILHAERLGASWKWVVVEGVAQSDLAKGPGHYPGTAMPGQVGNFVVSGHRTTHGAPFYDVNEFKAGDAIVVETRDVWYVYKVTGETVVKPSAIEVTYPVPGDKGAVPTQKLITLTTCNPRYSAKQRLIVHGVLASQMDKSAGEPAALVTGRA
ncbi:MAG TPA: class E sortase [Mycobacteriales bacterium]|jgi:sortase A|nr:class E sortase [Mycobacteriales bacterium]